AAVARQLQALGHEVEIVTAMPNYPTGRIAAGYRRRILVHENLDGVEVTRTWLYVSMGRGVKRLISYLSFAVTATIGLARRQRPDYIFVESPPLFLVITAALFARIWRADLIVNVSDLWPDAAVDLGVLPNGRALALARRLERWCYRRATIVNAVTDGIGNAIAPQRAPVAKLRTLPNGVDIDLFRPDRGRKDRLAELGLPDSRLILYTGNIGYAQGLDSIVHAAAKAGPDVTMAFVGDGSDRAHLERLATELGAGNIRFVPPVPLEVVAELLPLTSAVVVALRDLPTNDGARPSKIFPAFASGRPIIYAGSGEGADIVAAAAAGIVLPNHDADAITDVMRHLATNPAEGDRMGVNGRQAAEQRFSWASLVGKWVDSLPQDNSNAKRRNRRLNECD
ncbi:MAG: glycosyltransferase family 4 protein, partial [Actinomycetia bacterium]|nr:glycosyltransferase family 4 protein [Actinomycetes bacterium]